MAGNGKRRDRFTVRFTGADGVRRELCGLQSERQAIRICAKIEDLVSARRLGIISAELAEWLEKLDKEILQKLAEWGLCDPPKAKWTLKNLTDSFIESRKNAPPTSMQKYLQVQTNLHEYFTEGFRTRPRPAPDASAVSS